MSTVDHQHLPSRATTRDRRKQSALLLDRKRGDSQKYRALAKRVIAPEPRLFKGLSTGTRRGLTDFIRRWRNFCKEVFDDEDPDELLTRPDNVGTYISFLHWAADQSTMIKTASLLNLWSKATQYILHTTARPLEKGTWRHVAWYIRTTMKSQYQLKNIPRDKPILSFGDLQKLIEHHWNTAVLYTRPGAIVESRCRRGTNLALRWRDIDVLLWRPEDDVDTPFVIVIKVTLAFRKGDECSQSPQTFTLRQSTNLSMCPILHILALAFADHVFEVDSLVYPSDLLRLQIPPGLSNLQLKVKSDVLDVPVFRGVMNRGYKVALDPINAWTGKRTHKHMNDLGRSAGLVEQLSAYCIRRSTGNVIDSQASTATRNEVMGHSSSTIFEQHYFSQNIQFDVQAAVSGETTAKAFVERTISMGAYANPNAPFAITAEQRKVAWSQQEVVKKDKVCKEIYTDIRKRFRTVKASKGTSEFTAYQDAKKDLASERMFWERRVFNEARQNYFNSAPGIEIAKQLSNSDIAINLETPSQDLSDDFMVIGRSAFVDACYQSVKPNLAYTMMTIDILTRLCRQSDDRYIAKKHRETVNPTREEHSALMDMEIRDAEAELQGYDVITSSSGGGWTNHHTTNLTAQAGLESSSLITNSGTGNESDSLEFLGSTADAWNKHYVTTCGTGKKRGNADFPDDFWQKYCIFCYSNELANSTFRLKKFARIDGVRNHIDRMHISRLSDHEIKGCPLSACNKKLNGRSHLLNHVAKAHNFHMSKQYRFCTKSVQFVEYSV